MERTPDGQDGESRPLLLVFDLFNLVFRAYWALPKFTSSRGAPTGAVLGVARMVRKLMRDMRPDAVAIAMDTPAPLRRKAIYEQYKATRPAAPQDLVDQIPVIQETLRLLGLTLFALEGWEADDVAATLARRARESGWRVGIVSGDKDLAQLVDEAVHLVVDDPGAKRAKELDAAAVREKWGVAPTRIVDLLALVGDTSDNVPGVPKVGPKTALKLLEEHGTLEGVLDAATGMKPCKLRDNLVEGRDLALLSQRLVRLRDDLPIEIDWKALEPRLPPDLVELERMLEDLELRDLLAEVRAEAGGQANGSTAARISVEPGEQKDYGLAMTEQDLEQEIRRAREAGAVSVDLETTSVEPTRADIVGVSLSSTTGRGRYVPVTHCYLGVPVQLPLDRVLEMLGPLLEDPAIMKFGQNVKYEDIIFTRHGIRMQGIGFDTMMASYLLDPEKHQHKLDQISLERLGYRMISYDEVTHKTRGSQLRFDEVPVDEAARYSAEDAEVVWALVPGMRADLEREHLLELMTEVEIPLARVLGDMERDGISLDVKYLEGLEKDFAAQLETIEKAAWAAAGKEFNLASPKQLQTILFEDLGLKPVRKTKTGFSTDSDVLQELSVWHGLPAIVLEHRTLSKLVSTYTRALPLAVNPATGRVHTSYNQAVAATGRLSSSDPNLQNIPIRTRNGKLIRSAFRAAQGCMLLSADYSQIELRVLAHLSGDADLVESFRSGQDVHSRTASQVFGVLPALVDSQMRSRAKAINFGVIYGQTDYGLAQQLGIPKREAREFIERYFARYGGVKRYMDRVIEDAHTGAGVRTILGRRRFLRTIESRNPSERANAERMARNTPIQGSAADIIKLAMINVHAALGQRGLGARMVLTVHDELVLEVPLEEKAEVEALVRDLMQGAFHLEVPLVVDMGWGQTWGDSHP